MSEPVLRLLERAPDSTPALAALRRIGAKHCSLQRVEVDGEPLSILTTREPLLDQHGAPDWRWHVSVSAVGRVPTWREFVAAVHRVRPGIMFTVPLPPPQFWLNVNPYVLHAYEINDPTLERAWREGNTYGATPPS